MGIEKNNDIAMKGSSTEDAASSSSLSLSAKQFNSPILFADNCLATNTSQMNDEQGAMALTTSSSTSVPYIDFSLRSDSLLDHNAMTSRNIYLTHQVEDVAKISTSTVNDVTSNSSCPSTSTTATSRSQQRQQTPRRERRPDRAVYVPRARRSQTTPPLGTITTAAAAAETAITTKISTLSPVTQTTIIASNNSNNNNYNANNNSNNSSNPNQQQLAIIQGKHANASVNITTLSKADDENYYSAQNDKINNSTRYCIHDNSTSHGDTAIANIVTNERTPNCVIDEKSNSDYADDDDRIAQKELKRELKKQHQLEQLQQEPSTHKHYRSAQIQDQVVATAADASDTTSPTTTTTTNAIAACSPLSDQKNFNSKAITTNTSANTNKTEICDRNHHHQGIEILENSNMNSMNNKSNSNGSNVSNANNNTHKTNKKKSRLKKSETTKTANNSLIIEDVKIDNQDVDRKRNLQKCDIDEVELQRASKQINRSNRRIMKQTFISDVLEIPEKLEEFVENGTEAPNSKINRPESTITTSASKQSPPTAAGTTSDGDDEDDDWESKYDESGECLDPKVIQELTASVGKVKIETPQMDYSAYLTKQSLLDELEFPHVLEVSNFPMEFKNQDLMMIFSQYKESGFDIKWVDDTHALVIFSSSRIAAEVLTVGHPFVSLKPLNEATPESRLKAKKCASSLQPYRQRPETCPAMARRMVIGALGVRLATSAAERENERRVLREAKERKLLAAKQRDEVWES